MKSRKTGNILIVDDQDNWRLALSALLSADGHNVRAVGNYHEAVETVSQESFDVVILDIRAMC
jgi:DNA-binding NtrC family response regulator